PGYQRVARQAPPGPSALHSDRLLVAEPGRAVVWLPHRSEDPPGRPQERAGPGSRHQVVDQGLERQPQAFRVEEERGRDPGFPRQISSANFRRGTLGAPTAKARSSMAATARPPRDRLNSAY